MKTYFMSSIILVCFLLMPSITLAGPNITFTDGKWETTFNYGPCVQRSATWPAPTPVSCSSVQSDGIYWDWGGGYAVYAGEGHGTEVTASSNYPGGSGNGFRQWVWSAGADNYQTAPARVGFATPQKELWVRWYERYEAGFQWLQSSAPLGAQAKSIYFRALSTSNTRPDGKTIGSPIQPGSPYVYLGYANTITISPQGGGSLYGPFSETDGWNKNHPSDKSDGRWHCYEIYMKMDTGTTDGAGKIWRDGVLVASNTSMNWSNGDPDAILGWGYFELVGNKKDPKLTRAYYVDIDDLVVYNTAPPNKDAQGNPFIGPIISSISAPKGVKRVTP